MEEPPYLKTVFSTQPLDSKDNLIGTAEPKKNLFSTVFEEATLAAARIQLRRFDTPFGARNQEPSEFYTPVLGEEDKDQTVVVKSVLNSLSLLHGSKKGSRLSGSAHIRIPTVDASMMREEDKTSRAGAFSRLITTNRKP